jgi:hypothetical protein
MPATPSYILASYADPLAGRPELLENLADFERARAALDIAKEFRAPLTVRTVEELLRFGGARPWVELMQTMKDRCALTSATKVEQSFQSARLRVAAENICPAAGFYEAMADYIEASAEAVQKHGLPSALVGVPFAESATPRADAFSDEAAAMGLPVLVDRIAALETESRAIMADLLEPEQFREVADYLAERATQRAAGADLSDASFAPLSQRKARAVKMADAFAGRMYLDRQHLSAKIGITPATLDVAFERMEEVGRAVRLTQDVLSRSGAELFIPDMHARRSVFFQAGALAVLLTSVKPSAGEGDVVERVRGILLTEAGGAATQSVADSATANRRPKLSL